MPDVYEARAGFEKYDVRFIKRLDNGCMKGLAFIKDPDGYWIEILAAEGIAEIIRSQSLDDIAVAR